MEIIKNNKVYIIKEFKNVWKVSCENAISIEWELSKTDFKTLEEVKKYIISTETF